MQADQVLDCSGMSCPMPILKTKKAVDSMQTGQILNMISTDPGSIPDVEAWAKKTGNEVLRSEEKDGKYIFFIKRTK